MLLSVIISSGESSDRSRKHRLRLFNDVHISSVIRESLVNRELLVLVVTVDPLGLWDPLDLLDLLERLEER